MTNGEPSPPSAMFVQVQAGRGFAAPNNTAPADLLVLVTEPLSGVPITNLSQDAFTVINHFSNPGQACGFSNNITGFNNVGNGAYRLQVSLGGCSWVPGEFLLQLIVAADGRTGQAAAKFSIL